MKALRQDEAGVVMVSAMFKACDGWCGNLVRMDVALCSMCEELDGQFERKRMAMQARNLSYGVGEYARQGMGLAPCGEAADSALCGESMDLPTMLVHTTWRERLHVVVALGIGVTVLCLLATPWVLGAREICMKLFGI